jgi:3-keto-disaccharide hydrolase
MKNQRALNFVLAVSLFLCVTGYLSAQQGFHKLFDGKSLNGWTLVGGKGPGYVVKKGILVCPADGGGNLFTEKEYSNFIFRFEFQLTPGANNGVGIRAPLEGDAAYKGMEIQILDNTAPQYAHLKAGQYHGSIYLVVPAKRGFLKPVGQWNREEILAEGRHIRVTLNGTPIVDANLDDVTDPAVLEKHPGLARTTGHIGFLGHGTHVEFRNIRVKELE